MQMQLQSLHLNFSIVRRWKIPKSVVSAPMLCIQIQDPDSYPKDPELIGLLDPDPEP